MPLTLPGNKRINQLAAVIAVGFAVAAVWQEFGSRGEPGEIEFADAAMQQIKDQGAFTKEVCGLYAKAAVKGSREGALLLTQCVNQSYTGTTSDRRILVGCALSDGRRCRGERYPRVQAARKSAPHGNREGGACAF